MNETTGPAAGASSPARAEVLLPLVALLFAGSGCSALIYEIVWYQLLQLAIGSTAVSLGVLLATFMGGLCIGSLALPRILKGTGSFWLHPLRTYAAIELLIGVLGLIELVLIPFVGQAYLTGPQAGFAGMLLRGLAAAFCLLPPTILMGASLPAMARWIEASPRGVSWWSLLYGANTLGAVAGCLIAGFYLLRLFDVNIATYAAVAINLCIALGSFLLAARTPPRLAPEDRAAPELAPSGNEIGIRWTIPAAIALSGASALGAEVVWTRLMGLMLGATVYAFSIILAVFLVGLAIGAAVASGMVRGINPRLALGWCQMLAAVGIAWTAYAIADALPYWPVNPQLSKSPTFTFQIDMARTIWAILPATLFWGASLPFAFAAAAARGRDSGATVGGIYAANTAGAIFGALMVSLVLIPSIGTQNTQRALLVLSTLSGLLVLIPLMRAARTPLLELSAGVAVGLAALFVWGVHKVPDELIAFGRRMGVTTGMSSILYTAEGRNSSIAVSQWSDGALQFHVAGKVEASTEIYDMKLQRMLGHLPGLIHPNPSSVLVVGFGGGITAGTFTTYPSVKRIVICELEPLIPPTSTRYFADQNYGVMNDKRTQLVYDDARHFVAATVEKFDIITSDPIHPFVKGSATLYSKEYFELVKSHLKPGGIVTQWVPLYESDVATVKSEIATFFAVFPYATVWANNVNGQGYDIVLVGQLEPPSFNLDTLQARLDRRDYAPVQRSLANVNMNSVTDLLSTYAGNSAELQPWLKDAAINHDADLRLQYLAGLALNHAEEEAIYRQIMQYWSPPVELFVGSPQRLDALFSAMVTRPEGQESGPVKNPTAVNAIAD
ncbi:MAG TPA: fused MFS/spermidine synthase [Micropepsaceae bacterium]|nr:fused MFS/spermidine synthase [Micropepsaceae bacterium]